MYTGLGIYLSWNQKGVDKRINLQIHNFVSKFKKRPLHKIMVCWGDSCNKFFDNRLITNLKWTETYGDNGDSRVSTNIFLFNAQLLPQQNVTKNYQ